MIPSRWFDLKISPMSRRWPSSRWRVASRRRRCRCGRTRRCTTQSTDAAKAERPSMGECRHVTTTCAASTARSRVQQGSRGSIHHAAGQWHDATVPTLRLCPLGVPTDTMASQGPDRRLVPASKRSTNEYRRRQGSTARTARASTGSTHPTPPRGKTASGRRAVKSTATGSVRP